MKQIQKKNYKFLKPLGSWVAMLLAIALGVYTHNYNIQTLGILGAFAFHIFQIDKSVIYNLQLVAIHGVALVLSFFIGLVCSMHIWYIPGTILVISFILHLLTNIYGIPNPKYFFIIVFFIIGSNFKVGDWHHGLVLSMYLFIGVFTSLIMAFVVCWVRGFPNFVKGQNRLRWRLKDSYRAALDEQPKLILRAIHFSEIIFISAYLAMLMKEQRGYWILITSSAILLGNNFKGIKARSIDRLFGSMVGVLIGSALLQIHCGLFGKSIILSILFALVIYFAPRSYLATNFFATPQGYMLISLTSKYQPHHLMQYRLIDTVIGAVIAFGLVAIMEYGIIVAHEPRHNFHRRR